jgi:hypothetical protein
VFEGAGNIVFKLSCGGEIVEILIVVPFDGTTTEIFGPYTKV